MGERSMAKEQSPDRLFRFSFLPIPLLIAALAVVYFTVDPALFYDPPWLILIGNTLFVTVVSLAVSYIAMRNYMATGRIQVLLLGCGVLIFGLGGLIAAAVRGLPGGANLNVTIYNSGALFGGLFHFIASYILLAGISPEAGIGKKKAWLFSGYLGCVLIISIITFASLAGLLPHFFVQGKGPTLVRQLVLGTADFMFVSSFIIFIGSYIRNREIFLYLYACALALTSISLTAFFIQSSVGSVIGWVGRFSQYVGGAYFLGSIFMAGRTAYSRRTSMDNVLRSSLSGIEEKFLALAENTPDVIRRFDREQRLIYVNNAGLRLYGKPAGAILGKTMREAGFDGEECRLWDERIRKVFNTGQRLQAEDYFRAGKDNLFYQSLCVPEYGPDGSVANVLAVSRDLTEWKRMEDALRLSESKRKVAEAVETERKRLLEVLETLPAMICLLTSDYHIAFANRSFREKFSKFGGQHCYEYCFGQTEPCGFCETYDVFKTGRPHKWQVAAPDGSVIEAYGFPFTDTGGEHLILEMDFDITDHMKAEAELAGHRENLEKEVKERTARLETANKQLLEEISERWLVEQALRESEEKYRNLFMNMSEEVHFWELVRGEDGRIMTWKLADVNPPALKTWSKSIDDIKGKTTDEIFGEGSTEHYMSVVRKIFSEGNPYSYEDYFPNLDKFFRFTSVPMGRYFITTGADITAVKKALEAAEKANRAKSQFIANISHDLRTPLNAVLGYAQLLSKSQNLDEKQKDKVESIYKSGAHLLAVINDLLDLSKIEAGRMVIEKKEFDLPNLLERVEEIVRVQSEEKNLKFELETTSNLPVYIAGDETRLQQVLLNLLSNAVKFTEKGKVVLKVGGSSAKKNGTGKDHKYCLRFEVTDTGSGIPPDKLDIIFDSFQQLSGLNSEKKGTGLGLTISRDLVRLMGGDIDVKSRIGRGSAFRFEIDFDVVKEEFAQLNFESRNDANAASPAAAAETIPAMPPVDELISLCGMAKQGDIMKIRSYIEKIEASEPQLNPFALKIKSLAKQIKLKEIQSFLEEGIKGRRPPE